MSIFWIPPLVERIRDAILEERPPSPGDVRDLIENGPGAVEQFIDAIDNLQIEADALDKRISELKARKKTREQSVKRMRLALFNIIETSFNGKIETAALTAWNQGGVTRIRR